MACIILRNKTRWILEVKEIDLHEKETAREENPCNRKV